MDRHTAMTKARELWTKWVSSRPYAGFDGYRIVTSIPEEYEFYNLDLIHESMLREARWHATGKSTASPALISEVKGELILLGKIRKALKPKTVLIEDCDDLSRETLISRQGRTI